MRGERAGSKVRELEEGLVDEEKGGREDMRAEEKKKEIRDDKKL